MGPSSLLFPPSRCQDTGVFPLVHSQPLLGQSPFELYQRIASPSRPSFLLESGKGGSELGRYSFLATDPFLIFSGTGTTYSIRTAEAAWQREGNPLEALLTLVCASQLPKMEGFPPFMGGAVGYLSYDYARQLERIPTIARNDLGFPDMEFLFVELLVAIDHVKEILYLVFCPSAKRLASEPHDKLFQEGQARLSDLKIRLKTPLPPSEYSRSKIAPCAIEPNQRREDYVERVQHCQSFIRAGDIYQANLSHRFSIEFDIDPHSSTLHTAQRLFSRLRQVNPAPFSGILVTDRLTIVSSSPERLVQLRGDRISTRPIAGTRPRGQSPSEDLQFTADLVANKKERAEHLMLVDLARNDIGRVSTYGSVIVDEFMSVEHYSHVAHLVSNVSSTLRPDCSPYDLITAVFPGGTITGVPKIRCMEIIEELEPTRRGPYTGSLGYVSWSGDMDFNIIIRTLLLSQNLGYLQVGAGIVADSNPQREYEETLQKAQAFFSALQ